MATLNANGSSVAGINIVSPLSKLDGGAVPTWFFPESATDPFLQGEMVCLSGSAGNAVGLARPGTDASGYGILGFAADNASGSTSSFKGVWLATPDSVFVGNIGNSITSALSQTAASDLGQLYGLTSLSGRTYVDKVKTNASTASCRVIGFHDSDVVPSFYGKVKFVVLANKLQMYNSINLVTSSPLALVV
jgi:hypothetical protein